MRLLEKSIFSPGIDFFAFTSFIPIYFIYYLIFHVFQFDLPTSPPYLFFLLGWILVDGSHVYSTLLVSYLDKPLYQTLRPLMIGVPIGLIITSFTASYTGNIHYFFYLIAYLAMFHFIRQEFGWMKMATRLDESAPQWLMNLDKTTSYGLTIIPMLWFTRETNTGSWYRSGDLMATPQFLAEGALSLYWPIVILFVMANLFHTWRTKTINFSKWLVFTNTLVGWYLAKVYLSNAYLAIWLIIFHHGLPYFIIVFKTERVTQNFNWSKTVGKFKYPILYLSCVGIFYLFLKFHSGNQYLFSLKKNSSFWTSLIYSISVMPQMTHFVLDGFIWKRKRMLVKSLG